jgi:hypothetical protein
MDSLRERRMHTVHRSFDSHRSLSPGLAVAAIGLIYRESGGHDAAGGARALLGLQPPTGGHSQRWALQWDGQVEVCLQAEGAGDDAVQLTTLFDAAGAAVCSSVIVLGGVLAAQHTGFTSALLDFVDSHASDGE